jgi:hypothetical protein
MAEWSVLMSLFSWFDTQEVNAFARAIAGDLMGRLPASVEGGARKDTPERMHNAHEAITSRASAFARSHPLNWYTKAHLGNTFRWVLLEKGYDKAFVDTWTHNLLVAVTVSKASADGS